MEFSLWKMRTIKWSTGLSGKQENGCREHEDITDWADRPKQCSLRIVGDPEEANGKMRTEAKTKNKIK